MIRPLAILFLMGSLVVQLGCVGSGTYQKKVEEASCLTRDLSDLQRTNLELAKANEDLRTELAQLGVKVRELEEGNRNLERVIASKTDPAYTVVAELEREKAKLAEDMAGLLRAREEKVRDVSRIYESLLDRMKDEIAGGRLIVSELKGQVTVAVLDDAVFSPGTVNIKDGGDQMLGKIAGILKDLGENEIGVSLMYEIPEDVAGSKGRAPSPALLPAGRAMSVARFMKKNGIDPGSLTAIANGRFGEGADARFSREGGPAPRLEITVTSRD